MVRDYSVPGERGIVRDRNPVPQREPKARRVRKIRGPGGNEADTIDRKGRAEVDLYPFFGVRPGFDGAVITVRRACDAGRQGRQRGLLIAKDGDVTIQPGYVRAGERLDRLHNHASRRREIALS